MNIERSSPKTIAGGGLTGLTVAWRLQNAGFQNLTLFEKSSRLGGWIQTCLVDDYLFEAGPRGFRPTGNGLFTLDLVKELGLEKELVVPDIAAKKRYLLLNGRFVKVPLLKPLIKGLWKDLWAPASLEEDESVGSFFRRRTGEEFTEIFIDPLVTGIYAGDKDRLSMKACFPNVSEPLWKMAFRKRTESSPWSRYPLLTFKGGMETLTRALAKAFQGEIRLNTSAPAVDYICTPPRDIPYASAVVVNLGFKMQVTPFKAFGYLVPSSEKEEVLGVIFDSAAFPSLPGPEKLTVMLGGIRHPHMIHKSDSEILNLVFSHLRKHLSLRAFPSSYLIHRHGNAIPQYPIGYKGNGVGVNDAIKRSFDICNFK